MTRHSDAPDRAQVRGRLRAHPALRERPFDDTAVVLAHFNPCDYRTPERNLLKTLDALHAADASVLAVELLCGERRRLEPVLPTATNRTVVLASSTVWFHKEGLWNIGANSLPRRVERVLCLDADVIFDDPVSVNHSFATLEHRLAVQPYNTAVYLDRSGAPALSRRSMAWAEASGLPGAADPTKFHAGFGIGLRRDFWSATGGLYAAPLGGGDTMLLAALLGRPEGPAVSLAEQSAGAVGDYLDWAAKVRTWSPSGVDPLDATLVHLFHGSFENREYDTRNRLLAGFDPATDVATAGSGLAEWSDRARTERQDMIDAVSQYFSRRREDDG